MNRRVGPPSSMRLDRRRASAPSTRRNVANARMQVVAVTERVVAGRYRIVGRIAAGGMGEGFRAHDSVLGREVAVKVLHQQFAGDAGFVDRIRRDARAGAAPNHPKPGGGYGGGGPDATSFS